MNLVGFNVPILLKNKMQQGVRVNIKGEWRMLTPGEVIGPVEYSDLGGVTKNLVEFGFLTVLPPSA